MRRVKRSLSLVGLAVSLGLVVAFVVSLRWDFGYSGHKVVAYRWAPGSVVGSQGAIGVFFSPRLPPGVPGMWMWNRNVGPNFWTWNEWRPLPVARGPVSFLVVPMWVPLVLIAVPSLIAWRSTTRRPGHCRKCQYDLTGNVSGVCPECGTEVGRKLQG